MFWVPFDLNKLDDALLSCWHPDGFLCVLNSFESRFLNVLSFPVALGVQYKCHSVVSLITLWKLGVLKWLLIDSTGTLTMAPATTSPLLDLLPLLDEG